MNDARVDRIEETLGQLGQKVDGIVAQGVRLEGRVDRLALEMRAGLTKAFEQTQGGFDEHRKFTEFVVERSANTLRAFTETVVERSANSLRAEMGARFDQVDKRFEQVDKRFDRLESHFDRLEQLIKGR